MNIEQITRTTYGTEHDYNKSQNDWNGNNAQQFPLIQNANDDYCIFFRALKSYAQLLVFYTWWALR